MGAYGHLPASPTPLGVCQPQPYHLILRTASYRHWRAIVGIVLAVAGAVLVAPLLAGPVLIVPALWQGLPVGHYVDQVVDASVVTPVVLAYVNVSLALLIPLTWLLVRFVHRLRPRVLASVQPGLRWLLLARCAAVAMLLVVAQLVAAALLLPTGAASGDGPLPAADRAAVLTVVLLTTPFQAAGEEYLFRGYLLQALGALMRQPWVPVVLTALAFAVGHGLQNLPLFVDRLGFGLVTGWLVWRTGGLESGIALHAVNNVLVLATTAAVDGLTETVLLTEVSWDIALLDLSMLTGYAVAVSWLCRRYRVRTRTVPRAVGMAPADPA